MHAGFSFSYSSISVLLRQPLSIKKSYAGAIHLGLWAMAFHCRAAKNSLCGTLPAALQD
jgi:hypothetical protein